VSHWRKYARDDEMLVQHRPSGPANATPSGAEAEVGDLRDALVHARTVVERERIMGVLQERVGNARAAEIVRAVEEERAAGTDGADDGGRGAP